MEDLSVILYIESTLENCNAILKTKRPKLPETPAEVFKAHRVPFDKDQDDQGTEASSGSSEDEADSAS